MTTLMEYDDEQLTALDEYVKHALRYERNGLAESKEQAERHYHAYIDAGGTKKRAKRALDLAYDARQAAKRRTQPATPASDQPATPAVQAPVHGPIRQAVETFLSWLAFIAFIILLGSAVGWAYVYRAEQLAANGSAEQAQPTNVPTRPKPDAIITTQPASALADPSQPAAPTHPFVLPDGTQGAWAPNQAPVADIGGRKYREIQPGQVELDDGTQLWIVTDAPAAAPAVAEQPNTPQGAPVAQSTQPNNAPAPAAQQPAAQPVDLAEASVNQVERIVIVGASALDVQNPEQAAQQASDAITTGKEVQKAGAVTWEVLKMVIDIPGTLDKLGGK